MYVFIILFARYSSSSSKSLSFSEEMIGLWPPRVHPGIICESPSLAPMCVYMSVQYRKNIHYNPLKNTAQDIEDAVPTWIGLAQMIVKIHVWILHIACFLIQLQIGEQGALKSDR
jgi:hypothetical protein